VDFLHAVRLAKEADPTYNPKVFLWQRKWFQRDGNFSTAAGEYTDNQVEEFAQYMADTINLAKTSRCTSGVCDDNVLAGIAVIETNLEGPWQTLWAAKALAQRINAKTGGWLKTHSFFFPGAGLGAHFADIDSQSLSAGFFGAMAAEVKFFAFIFKGMVVDKRVTCPAPSGYQHPLCDLQDRFAACRSGFRNVGGHDCGTVAGMRDWLADDTSGPGLDDLKRFITSDRESTNPHTWVANVISWGDFGDGLNRLTPGMVSAIHRYFVEEPWPLATGGQVAIGARAGGTCQGE
jgi:hypothetical protein